MSSAPNTSSGLLIRAPDPHCLCTLARFEMAFERVHDTRLDGHEVPEYLRQKAATE